MSVGQHPFLGSFCVKVVHLACHINDGRNLMALPLLKRKEALAEVTLMSLCECLIGRKLTA